MRQTLVDILLWLADKMLNWAGRIIDSKGFAKEIKVYPKDTFTVDLEVANKEYMELLKECENGGTHR